MKIKDVAHNHSLTDLLKVSIFSLLMLAPMINVGVRSAYVICNKNAKDSYYGETINETIVENANNTYKIGQEYQLTIGNKTYAEQDEVRINVENVTSDNITGISTTTNIRIKSQNSNTYAFFYNGNTYLTDRNLNVTYSAIVNFTYLGDNGVDLNSTYNDIITYKSYNNYSYLDNVFEYSVSQLTESPLYNWVENTAIYSGVALMNTQLGITQPVISLLVVYWLLLTIIYIIIDIVIRVFTWLTHMIGSKTA